MKDCSPYLYNNELFKGYGLKYTLIKTENTMENKNTK